jgi:hypothetical protein
MLESRLREYVTGDEVFTFICGILHIEPDTTDDGGNVMKLYGISGTTRWADCEDPSAVRKPKREPCVSWVDATVDADPDVHAGGDRSPRPVTKHEAKNWLSDATSTGPPSVKIFDAAPGRRRGNARAVYG